MRYFGVFCLFLTMGLSLSSCGSDDPVSSDNKKTADLQEDSVNSYDNDTLSSPTPATTSSEKSNGIPASSNSVKSNDSKASASSGTPAGNDKTTSSATTKSSTSTESGDSAKSNDGANSSSSEVPASSEAQVALPTFTDTRDGNTYKYVTIGTQTWMAENLRYKPQASTEDYPRGSSSYVKKYGYFYTFSETVEPYLPMHPFQGACPSGWYVPTYMDFVILANFIGGVDSGYKLKSTTGWDDGTSTDEYNFNALNTSSNNDYPSTTFLTASYASNTSGSRYATLNNGTKIYFSQISKDVTASIRCIKESVADTASYEILSSSAAKTSSSSNAKSSSSIKYSSAEPSSSVALNKKFDIGPLQTLHDTRDNHWYNYVYVEKIQKSWMVENLNYLDALEHLKDGENTWCYDNLEENCEKYGRLYTWGAAMDSVLCVGNDYNDMKECGYGKKCDCSIPIHHPADTETKDPWQGICPKGWYLPSYDDWKELFWAIADDEEQYSLVFTNVAYYLKSTTDWEDYYENGVDYYKFSIYPAGYADANPANASVTFSNLHKVAGFWTSTESSGYNANIAEFFIGGKAYLRDNTAAKYRGFSVRCIR